MTPALPATVRIGALEFAVRPMNRKDSDNLGSHGYMSEPDSEIGICIDRHPRIIATTFLHEVLHAIHMERGLNEESREEALIDQLSNGLVAFMGENPQAVAFVLASIGVMDFEAAPSAEIKSLRGDA